MAKKNSNTLSALQLFVDQEPAVKAPVCVLAGDDGFLQHEAKLALLRALEAEDSVETFNGRHCELRDVLDALREKSLFGGDQRVVVVEDADQFVKQYRGELEDYVAKPSDSAVLILECTSWPGNTRLAKAVADSGLAVRCQTPDKGRELAEFTSQLKTWLEYCAKQQFDCTLERGGSDALLEQLEPTAGVLYQEVARLSLLAGAGGVIDGKLVREHVGGWRTRKTWDMIDAAADGNASSALQQLDRLLAAGEEPHALLPQMASTLRRFAMAVRIFEQAEQQGKRGSLRSALERAGAPKFKLNDMERQMRQIGRDRARLIYDWLLAADLGLKGYNSTKDRARRVIETLIVRLAQKRN
ncbi:DNA polymerase III subunit delta [Adhaeretor mobilis]|nr:DNA polymerase III subunit delta [Adhaeretor mobilis]